MSKLDDLIKQYCPDGAEYKRLGDVGTFRRGGNFQKKDMTSSGVPCIHYGQIYVYYGLFSSSTISFLPTEIAETQKKAEKRLTSVGKASRPEASAKDTS